MDYKQKYNDTLKKFKSFKEKYFKSDTDFGDVLFDKTGEMQKAFNSIFPELAESEDEKIRKILLKMAKVPRKEIYEHEGITKEQAISYLEKQKGNQYFVGYTKGYSEGQLNPKQKEPTPTEPELKIPDWVHGGWDDEYMINTVIGRYSLHTEVAKKRGNTHDYNLSKSMENWLRNVVKPLILEKQKENLEEPKIAFGDWGDKEKQEAIFTCLKYMRFVKKITNQEYDDLTKWLNDNLVSNVLEKDGWTIANEQTDTIKEDYYGAFLRGEMRRQKEQKEPHYTKRNALFDKCVENCDPKTVEEVNKRVDDIMNMSELSAFEQALTNFIGYWEDDEEHWPSQFVKKHGKHILDMAREELEKEQKPADLSEMMVHKEPYIAPVPIPMVADEQKSKEGQKPRRVERYNELVFKDICKHLEVEGYSGWVLFLNALRNGEFQPKQEWSEDDEEIREGVISDLCALKDWIIKYDANWLANPVLKNIDKRISWLKSLRPQKLDVSKLENYDPVEVLNRIKTEWTMAWEKVVGKQEWSEEDKKLIDDVINSLCCYQNTLSDYQKEIVGEEIRKLKSLRPHWKPSNEQMKALDKAIPVCMGVVGRDEVAPLESLYEQLKKL